MRECIRQPLSRVRLAPRFNKPNCCAWVPSLGFSMIGNEGFMTQTVSNPGYSGPRFIPDAHGMAAVSYADHGGNNDDRFDGSIAIPTARVGAFTTVLDATFIPNGLVNQTAFEDCSHRLQVIESGNNIQIGYAGGNGYNRYYYGGSSVNLFNQRVVFVVSSTPWTPIVIAINGVLFEPNIGLDEYVGGGLAALSTVPSIHPGDGWANYYGMNGRIRLFACLPGVFLSRSEAVSVSLNPWQIFVEKSWSYSGLGSGSYTPIEISENSEVGTYKVKQNLE